MPPKKKKVTPIVFEDDEIQSPEKEEEVISSVEEESVEKPKKGRPKKSQVFLNEKIYIDKLNRLLAAPQLSSNERLQLSSYMKKYWKPTKYIGVSYNFSQRLQDKGRLFADGSLSLSSIKKQLAVCLITGDNGETLYIDVDIVNCHVVLLRQYCEKQNPALQNDWLLDYENRREYWLSFIMDYHKITRTQAKNLILRLCYGGAYKLLPEGSKDKEDEYEPKEEKIGELVRFSNQLKKIMNNLKTTEEKLYKEVVKNNKEGKNELASLMSIVAQRLENDCLMAMLEYFRYKKKLTVGVLCFDGLMIEKDDVLNNIEGGIPELLRRCQNYVFIKTGYNITLESKPLNKPLGFDLPEELSVINNDHECINQIFILEGSEKFKYCKKQLYIYDERTGMYSDDIHVLFYYLYKHQYKLMNNFGKSYGNDCQLQSQTVQAFKTRSKDDGWLERTDESSKGYLLFQDGIYNMKTGQFNKGYDPTIVFHHRVERIFPKRNQALVDYVTEIFSSLFDDYTVMRMCLSRAMAGDNLKSIYFCPGETNSGKSSLALMFHNAFGEYIGTFSFASFLYKKNDNRDEGQKNRWAFLLRYKRIIFSQELNIGTLSSNDLKKHSGRDKIVGRGHGENETPFYPHYTIIGGLNDIPPIEPLDLAMEERMQLIEFKYIFCKDPPNDDPKYKKAIPEFEKVIAQDDFIDGFIHLILDGYADYMINGMIKIDKTDKNKWNEGIKQGDQIEEAVNSYFDITKDKNDFVPAKEIAKFRAENKTFESMSLQKLRLYLKEQGVDINARGKDGGKGYKGIKVKSDTKVGTTFSHHLPPNK